MSEIKTPFYRLYIDESGDHTYINLTSVPHRYLGLLGCIFERQNDYKKAAKGLETLKRNFWPDPNPDKPVIFHREEMVNQRGYFSVFKNKNIRETFDNCLIDFLKEQNFTIIIVVLDKKGHVDQYKYPINPYDYCLTAMLERYCGWLGKVKKSTGDVLAESRSAKEDRQLKAVYKNIYHKGTNQREATFFRNVLTSCEIKIKPKIVNIAGLQIADLLAYPLKEKLLYSRGIRTTNFLGTFNAKVYNAVKDKFNRQFFTGIVTGYGEVFR